MPELLAIHFESHLLEEQGLPDLPYPVCATALEASKANGGELPWAEVLFGMQLATQAGRSPWTQYGPAMTQLAALLAEQDDQVLVTALGDNWWMEIADASLNGEVVTIQRGDQLLCTLGDRGDGRLQIAAYRPLDAKSIRYLLTLAQAPDRDGKFNGYASNWDFAFHAAGAADNETAAKQGEAYLAYWGKGVGLCGDGTAVPLWYRQVAAKARRPSEVAAELGVFYRLTTGWKPSSTPAE